MAHINFSTEEAAAGWKTQARETLTYWVPEVDIKGTLPKDLVGTFFRNGTILALFSQLYLAWFCFSTRTLLFFLLCPLLHKQPNINDQQQRTGTNRVSIRLLRAFVSIVYFSSPDRSDKGSARLCLVMFLFSVHYLQNPFFTT